MASRIAAFPSPPTTVPVGIAGSNYYNFIFVQEKWVLRGTMIVVVLLLIALVCIIYWDSIIGWFLGSGNSSDTDEQMRPQEMQRQDKKRAGLKPAVVDTIPVMPYASHSPQLEWRGLCNECMICLSDFQDGEMVRVLPICGHLFHMKCVDVWFHLHTSCPVCRQNIVQSPGISASTCDEQISEQLRGRVNPPQVPSVSLILLP